MTDTKKSTKRTVASNKKSETFSAEERSAIKERAKEQKAASTKAGAAADLLAKIADMAGPDRAMAERLHAVITTSAPDLAPKTWYGMPAYAKGDKIICFFQPAAKFKTRYATLGFNDDAKLDDGTMWPVAYALTTLTAADEARIGALVKKAVS
jgi:hypothetical protein